MILETTADRLQLKLPYDLRERAKAAHGYRWDPELKVWYWPKTLVNFLLIRDAIPNLQLSPDASKWLRERTSIPQVNDLATVDARLWPFQKYGVRFLQRVGRALLLDEMGTGKSAQSVVAAQTAGFRRILVLCPKSLQYNWEAEIRKWTGPGTPVTVPTGSSTKKAQQIAEAAGSSWVVTNWETARYADLDLGWDCIIGDEAHRIRNRKTQLSEAIRKLKSDALWLLTGTPIHNSQEDLWQPLNWLYPKEFSSFWSFYEAFVWYQDTMWGREVVGAKNTEVLWKLIAPFSLRRSKAEVLPDLPEKLSITVPVKLDSKQMTLYKRIERETLIDLQSGERLMVMGALAMLTRLKQAALCPWVFGESQEVPAGKLETALDMITDNASEQFVVYSQYAEVVKVFSRLLQEQGIMPSLLYGELSPKARQEQVLAFTGQQTRVMLATTETGGVGLTFVPASNVIFLDHVWNPAIIRQAEDRCIAEGQLVITLDGVTPIENVNVGDLVLTHLGRFRPVTAIHNRLHRGLMTRIQVFGYPNTLHCTHDHRVLVARGSDVPKWMEAHDILPRDELLTPIIQAARTLSSVGFPDGHRRYSKEELTDCRICQVCGAPVVARQLCASHYQEWKRSLNGAPLPAFVPAPPGKYVSMPQKIELDDDFLYLLGWYAAEGFASTAEGKGCFISLSGHEKERPTLERLGRRLGQYGINWSIYAPKGVHGLELRAYSAELAHWFVEMFGHRSTDKHLPPWTLRLSVEQTKTLLQGYLDGDGYKRNNTQEWVSASTSLAVQIALLVAKTGRAPTLHLASADPHWVGGYTISGEGRGKNDGLYVHHYVRSVMTSIAARGTRVYDLTVEEDHSFVANGVTVHNCHRIGQKSTCRIYHLVARNTIDETIQGVLRAKSSLAAQVLTPLELIKTHYGL